MLSKTSRRLFVALAMLASPLIPVSLLASPAQAAACDVNWTGTTNTAWATGTNWSGGSKPTSGQNVCIDGSLPNQPVISTTENVNSITTTNDGELTVSGFIITLSVAADSNISNLILGGFSSVITNGVLTTDNLTMVGGESIAGSGSLVTTGDVTLSNPNTISVDWSIQNDNTNTFTWTTNGALNNSGHTITVADGGVFDSSGTTGAPTLTTNGLITTGGTIVATGIDINGPVTLDNGLFFFDRTITGALSSTNGSTIVVGSGGAPAVTAAVTGAFTQDSGGIEFNVNGPGVAGTAYDRLNVGGALTLTNEPQLSLANPNSYNGTLGDAFDLIHAASVSGTYAMVTTDFVDTTLGASASYSATDVTATVVPAPGQIEGTAYEDETGNGTKDGGESGGVENATIYDDVNNNSTLDMGEPSDVTNSAGTYILAPAPAGTAHVRVQALGGYIQTTTQPVAATIAAGATVQNVDVGLFKTGSISGLAFTDVDGNGVKDTGDDPISGVTIYIDTNDDNAKTGGEPTTTTASDGTYSFTGLTYTAATRVRAVAPDGLLLTTDDPFDHNIISGADYTDDDFGFNTTGPAMPSGPQFGGGDDPISQGTGYWFVGADGTVYSFGDAEDLGSPSELDLNSPIVGITPSPSGAGYWAVGSDGGVFAYGDAPFLGSAGSIKLNKPVVGMTTTPSGEGYWLVAKDGGVFSYGDATFYGSAVGVSSKDVVGIAATPSGEGYWMVARDGGVFAYGDAKFYGSMGGQHLNSPIVGIAASATGEGYRLVAADGGVFAFGDAEYFGGAANLKLNAPIVSIKALADGSGYWLIAADGGVFSYGSAGFFGTPPTITSPVAQ